MGRKTATPQIDCDELNARHDLRVLAGAVTTLHRESVRELSGPCPKCGGDDRLHAAADYWFCRHCYPLGNGEPHDAIAFVRWLYGLTFPEALAMLGAESTPPRPQSAPPRAAQETQDPAWIAASSELLRAWQAALWMPDNPGYEYAVERGFTEETLKVFGVGFAADGPGGGGPALALPWFRGGVLYAVRLRYLSPIPGQPRIKSLAGSHMRGILFGGQALPTPRGRTLILVEGELNAMSIWQVAHDAHVDVLSLGGQDQAISPAAVTFAQAYAARIVWMDDEKRARSRAELVGGSAFWSGEPKRDANDRLQDMSLRPLLAKLIERTAPASPQARADLYRLGA